MRILLALLLVSAPLVAADFTVHEWGTFTSVVASDGRMLSGLEVEEESVPSFVRSFTGFAPYNKGWDRPLGGVTVKMETPVLYFYSATPLSVRVDVGFNGGSISQWYPDRSGGEVLADGPKGFSPTGASLGAPPPIDFRLGYKGSASWRVDVLARDASARINAPASQETAQWRRARVPGANLVRGVRGEVEGFIFYRGLGNFALPLRATCDAAGRVQLTNTSATRIPFVLVYDHRAPWDGADAMVRWFGPLEPGEARTAPEVARELSSSGTPAPRVLNEIFPAALEAAGLSREEAAAMLATWRESYFARPGLRVFWIVPRSFTDAILPLSITPAPRKLERVLVGRTEVLPPDFERQLARDFAMDGGKRYEGDRYFRAYRERVQQLGPTVGVAPMPRTP